MLISEATLRSLFGIYGEVVDVALKKSQFDKVSQSVSHHTMLILRPQPDSGRGEVVLEEWGGVSRFRDAAVNTRMVIIILCGVIINLLGVF